jgi:hypothetical protein
MKTVTYGKAWVAAAAMMFFAPSLVAGQEPDAETLRKNRLEEMRRRAEELVVHIGRRKVEPVAEPLLRFGDPTRAFHDGTLWVWSDRGRPLAMASIEHYETVWAYELISLSDAPFELRDATGWLWKPAAGPTPQAKVPEAPAPAETTQTRQRQARALSLRFSALELIRADTEKVHLRLQPRPIHQYQDRESGLLDGVMFVFSNGTNPEVLLILEAVKPDGADPHWRYALAPVSTAALEASLDDRVVWTAKKTEKPKDQSPYTYFGVPISSAPATK